jgi:hypothetical protein
MRLKNAVGKDLMFAVGLRRFERQKAKSKKQEKRGGMMQSTVAFYFPNRFLFFKPMEET